MAIVLEILDQRGQEGGPGIEDAVLVSFDRPGRIEVAVRADRLLVHIYDGAAVDPDQRPLLSYEPDETDLSPGDRVSV